MPTGTAIVHLYVAIVFREGKVFKDQRRDDGPVQHVKSISETGLQMLARTQANLARGQQHL